MVVRVLVVELTYRALRRLRFNYSEYMGLMKRGCQNIRDIDPESQCVAPFQTVLSPDLAPGDIRVRWTDAVQPTALSIQKGTRVLISLWDSLMFGRVPGTRPNIP